MRVTGPRDPNLEGNRARNLKLLESLYERLILKLLARFSNP